MLMQTNPEVTKLQSQIDNNIALRGVIQRKIDEGHDPYCLNSYRPKCGTYGCVLFDWVASQGVIKGENDIINSCTHIYLKDYENVFSFTPRQSNKVFGPRWEADFNQRLATVKGHISTLEQRMANMLVAA